MNRYRIWAAAAIVGNYSHSRQSPRQKKPRGRSGNSTAGQVRARAWGQDEHARQLDMRPVVPSNETAAESPRRPVSVRRAIDQTAAPSSSCSASTLAVAQGRAAGRLYRPGRYAAIKERK